MKLNKISTLWEFLPAKPKGYNVEDTLGYMLWALLYAASTVIIINNNLHWLCNNYQIFTVKIIKQLIMIWLCTAPISYYFAINECYNKYLSDTEKK